MTMMMMMILMLNGCLFGLFGLKRKGKAIAVNRSSIAAKFQQNDRAEQKKQAKLFS